jgi:hypothetical protein
MRASFPETSRRRLINRNPQLAHPQRIYRVPRRDWRQTVYEADARINLGNTQGQLIDIFA